MNRQPSVVSYSSRAPRSRRASALPITNGARVMDSTPPAMNTSPSPTAIACAAALTAWSPEPHSRFTVWPATSTGSPASSAAIRATLRLSSPAWLAQPSTTSSMSAGVDARSIDDRTDDERRKVVGSNGGQRAAVAAHGGPHGLDEPSLADGAPRIPGHRQGAGSCETASSSSSGVTAAPVPPMMNTTSRAR